MKILLIGKNGQLGAEINRQSRSRKHETIAFGREELDITDSEKVKSRIESLLPTVVINASAYHVVPDCELYPDKAFAVNATSLKNLADVCTRYDSKLIHYSTDYIFDGLKGSPYDEDDKPNPLQIYGLSKLAGEYIVLNYSENGIVIRACGVYGGKYGSRSKKGNFVLNILKKTKEKDEIEVSSEQITTPTYAVDLAKATLDLLEHKEILGIYHLVNESYCSWAEFAGRIVKIKGLTTKIIPVDRKGMDGSLKRPFFSALKNTRAAKLGVKLPSWQDALGRYLATLS
ncbi:MAG: dTDP-4-dehydrorhamnose reductase [Patescibacteria group bacterium]